MLKKLEQDIYNIRFALIAILIYSVIMNIAFGTICPVKGFFNVPCPACGLTHASIYLFTGKIKQSFEANLTCILWIIAIILFFIDRYVHKLKFNFFNVYLIITALITITVYIYKMIYIF